LITGSAPHPLFQPSQYLTVEILLSKAQLNGLYRTDALFEFLSVLLFEIHFLLAIGQVLYDHFRCLGLRQFTTGIASAMAQFSSFFSDGILFRIVLIVDGPELLCLFSAQVQFGGDVGGCWSSSVSCATTGANTAAQKAINTVIR